MISLLEIAERTQKGPKVDQGAWNMGLFHKMNELTKRHDIRCPRDGSFFNTDDALVERAFHAAIDFLVEKGVYCVNTGRVVQFSREEVLQAIGGSASEVRVGEGRDVRVLKQRRIEEHEALSHCPGLGAPYSQELSQLAVATMASLPGADYLESMNFREVDGREIFGMPLEAYAARRQMAWMREGVRKAGKPGMAVACYPINIRASVLIAPMDQTCGLRPVDGVLLSMLPDVKLEQDMLTAAIIYDEYGCFRRGSGASLAGGFCGGVEGAIIEALAKGLAGWICYHDSVLFASVGSIATGGRKPIKVNPDLSWATSVVCQAFNTHFHTVLFQGGTPDSGPGTETMLLEIASEAVQIPLNGCNVHYPRQSRTQADCGQTPVESEWRWEVTQAVMRNRLTRAEGDVLCRKVAALLDGREAEPAVPMQECYDWVDRRPTPAYRDVYLRVKEKVAACGLQFD